MESISEPTHVNIVNIKRALEALCISVKISSDNLFSLQTDVQDNIEKCKKRKKQHDSDIETKRNYLKTITIQLKLYNSDINAFEKEAKDLDTKAAGLEKNGEELRERSDQNKRKTAVGGIVAGVVGLVLAPATGGASLLVATAGATINAAVNMPKAIDNAKRAQNMREQAESTRKEAQEHRIKKREITNSKSVLELEIKPLEKDADELSNACRVLKEITEILFTISDAMDYLQQVLQNTEVSIKEVHLRADAFKIIQTALQNRPGHFEERAQIYFENLRDSWVMVEHFLIENCAKHTGVEY